MKIYGIWFEQIKTQHFFLTRTSCHCRLGLRRLSSSKLLSAVKRSGATSGEAYSWQASSLYDGKNEKIDLFLIHYYLSSCSIVVFLLALLALQDSCFATKRGAVRYQKWHACGVHFWGQLDSTWVVSNRRHCHRSGWLRESKCDWS